MDEFERSDLEKETSHSDNTCYQNAIRYKEKENAIIKSCKCGLFSLLFVIKLGGGMTEIFSVGLQKTDCIYNHVILKYIIPLKSSQQRPIQIQ